MFMKLAVVLLLVAAVAISGCSSRPVNTSDSNGLSIKSFTASPVNVRSGELVIFDLQVENVGGTTARNVQADLFGVQDQWKDIAGANVDSTLPVWGDVTMRPPFADRSIPGDLRMANWQIITPDIPQGITTGLPIKARVTYDYNTSGFLQVKLISDGEWRRLQLVGQQVTEPFSIQNSAGPLKLSIDPVFQRPIIVDTTQNDLEYPFRIQIDNVGDGFPITPEDDGTIRGAGGRLQGTIDLLGPGAEFSDCLGTTGGTHIDLDDAQIMVRLREIGRGSVPVACNIKINKDTWGTRPEDSIKMVFNIRYRYYVSSDVNVVVTGQ